MTWATRKEYCEGEGIKLGAFKKRKAKGQVQWRYAGSGRGGEAGKHIEIWIDDEPKAEVKVEGKRSASSGVGRVTMHKHNHAAVAGDADLENKDRYKVHRGEPGCNIVTPFENGEPMLDPGPAIINKDVFPSSSPPSPCEATTHASQGPFSPGTSRCNRIANLRYALIQDFQKDLKDNHRPRIQIVQEFLDLYNTGVSHPDIFRDLGNVARSTLYEWIRADNQAGIFGLAPQYGGTGISKVTDHEKNLLLSLLLHQNRLKIAYAIKLVKNYLAKKKIESSSSPSTLRRFADQFKKEHYDLWVLHREGEKALDDKVLPYIERDRNLLEVGEGLVADGHRLNFQVINPFTGKPCRAAMVLFWDWRSSFPLGWEIMLEENIQCISTALRNAILTLGKIPKWILMDNGKAFKAKIFTSDINLTETEILGMFARLNVNTHFAWPYNAKSKPIERFFGVFTDWFERLLPSFTGSSIEDKPAWTKRNEKLARSAHNSRVPTIPEINDLMHEWREFYADQPSKGLDGHKPRDIFESGKGPGIDPAELTYLMMPREIKNITRNGIDLFGCYWFDEALYGLRDRVLIKYSLSDLSQIYCFYKNEFLCILKPRPKAHPMASESGTPKDVEDVKRMIAQKRGLKNQTTKLYKMLGHKSSEQLPWKEIIQEVPDVVETIEKIEAEKPRAKTASAFVEEEINAKCEARYAESANRDKNATVVDLRTGLSRPGDGTVHEDQWEKYDWYMAVKKETPEVLNNLDYEWIAEYEATDQWKRIYAKHAIGGER